MKLVTIDITSETPELTFSNVGIPGPRGIEGKKGEPFTYSDFTPEQLADLKGEKGDAFVFADFTDEQLAFLKGEKGDSIKGDTGGKGDKGEKGDSFTYADMSEENKEDLRAPLRTHFDAEIVKAESAATEAEASKISAEDSKAEVLQAKTDILAAKTDIEGVQADITGKAKDVTDKHGDIQALASQVDAQAQQVTSDVTKVEDDRRAVSVDKQAAETARDLAQAAASTAQASLAYEGTWDASTGAYPTKGARNGLWKVTAAGTVGGVSYTIGDDLIWYNDASKWERVPSASAISSVNGYRVGDVVLTAADVGALPATTQLFSGKYTDLTGIPSVFPAATHNHSFSSLTSIPATALRWPTWAEVSGKPSLFSGAWGDLTGKPSSFPADPHTHAWSQITGKPNVALVGQSYTKGESDGKYLLNNGTGSIANRLNVYSSGDTAGFPNATPDDVNNYINKANIAVKLNNNGLFIFGDRVFNSRRMAIQSSHGDDHYSNVHGILDLNPYGGQVRANGYNVYHTGYKPSAADVGAYTKAEADGKYVLKGTSYDKTSSDARYLQKTDPIRKLNSAGRVTALTGGAKPDYGMRMVEAYSNGYPYQYGNVIQMQGNGAGEMLIGWSGVSGGHAPVYVRSQRDVSGAPWSPWAQVYTSAFKPSPADIGALPANARAKDSSHLGGLSLTFAPNVNTVAGRDGSGDISARLFRANYQTQTAIAKSTAGICFRIDNGDDNYMRFVNKDGMVDWLGRVNDSTRLAGKTVDTVKAEARAGLVPDSRTVNGKRLNSNISISKADVGLGNTPNYGATNSWSGTSTSLLATQRAAYDAAAAPRLSSERKRRITYGTGNPSGGASGDIYIQYK